MPKILTREQRNKLDTGGGCSVCKSKPGEIVMEVGDHYWLCEDCTREEHDELVRSRALIEMQTYYLTHGLPNAGGL
jgi:hypothetical protein